MDLWKTATLGGDTASSKAGMGTVCLEKSQQAGVAAVPRVTWQRDQEGQRGECR